jgi:hypothetical protein
MTDKFEPVPGKYKKISEIPRGKDIFYRCLNCGGVIPSIPEDSIGCECGKVFIDKDYRRLIVENLDEFEVVRKV